MADVRCGSLSLVDGPYRSCQTFPTTDKPQHCARLPPIQVSQGPSMSSGDKMADVKAVSHLTAKTLITVPTPPQATLPNIDEFLQKHCGSKHMWGYRELGGANRISKSRRTNHAPPRPHRVTPSQLSQWHSYKQTKKQLRYDVPRKHEYDCRQSQFAVFPSTLPHTASRECEGSPVLTQQTLAALSTLHTQFYCRSVYTRDYQQLSVPLPVCVDHQEQVVEESLSAQEVDNSCHGNVSEGVPLNESCEEFCQENLEESADEETAASVDGHMTLLPGHVIIAQLPNQSRGDTSKCTRPPNLVTKPTLLSRIRQKGVASIKKWEGLGDSPRGKDIEAVELSTDTLPAIRGCEAPLPTLTPPTLSQAPPLTLPKVVTNRSGCQPMGFKSRAHARYHALYPDAVPDLRDSTIHPKKMWFCGCHASLLRG